MSKASAQAVSGRCPSGHPSGAALERALREAGPPGKVKLIAVLMISLTFNPLPSNAVAWVNKWLPECKPHCQCFASKPIRKREDTLSAFRVAPVIAEIRDCLRRLSAHYRAPPPWP
ncbi:hypothetical protein BgiMline_009683 [Biomphalaria glabrata]|nr:hypothetical protein BgiMline_023797 [Biomphalaria glabrata]